MSQIRSPAGQLTYTDSAAAPRAASIPYEV